MTVGDRHCQKCGALVALDGPIGRRDSCDGCGVELHACAQCRFFDLSASNQCREPQAERVGDKERGNYCEFFQLALGQGQRAADPAQEAKARLEALFKK